MKKKNLSHNLYSEEPVDLSQATAVTLEITDPIYPYLVLIGDEITYEDNLNNIIERVKLTDKPAVIFKRLCPKAHAWTYYLEINYDKGFCEACSDIN